MRGTYKVATIVASKLRQDWVIQGLTMAYRVAYLVKNIFHSTYTCCKP